MSDRPIRIAFVTLIAAATVACSVGAPSQAPSPTPLPAATTFDEYAVAFCSAWDSLFLAVGNPDTAEGSVLSKALDAAVIAHDGATAEQVGAQITVELKSGRQDVAVGGTWPPATPMMVQLDRVFAGFEVMTAAKVAKAKSDPTAIDPQAALEGSGAIVAWTAMLEAHAALGAARPAVVQRCGDLPISP